ncbi:MAG TPA: hypothetical protein VN688_18495 [Gemmataceae bacterium]|nr:hypothetical protein [Gemmataceae bacterium]
MGRCQNCGATVQDGTVCTSCDRSFDVTVADISRKVRGLRLTRGVAGRWGRRGAVVGFVVGSVLSFIFAGFELIRHLVSPPWQETMADVLAMVFTVFLLVAVIFLPLTFAAVFLVYGGIIKPIFVALFCSVERFEQEYGSWRK